MKKRTSDVNHSTLNEFLRAPFRLLQGRTDGATVNKAIFAILAGGVTFSLLVFAAIKIRAACSDIDYPPEVLPIVCTDANDYPPGAEAYINGIGFDPLEMVQLQVLHADETPATGQDHEPWQVQADDDGVIETAWHVCTDDCVGKQVVLTAIGLSSGNAAQAVFTDSANGGNVPILYYDFEDNGNRNVVAGFQNAVEQAVNAGSGALTKAGGTGAQLTIVGVGGAGQFNGGTSTTLGESLSTSAGGWNVVTVDPGTTAANTNYYQFTVNTTGFQDIFVSFDNQASATGPARAGVLWSVNGGATFTESTTLPVLTGNAAFSASGQFTLGATANNAAAVIIRIYAYAGSAADRVGRSAFSFAGTFRVDNVAVSATTVISTRTLLDYTAIGTSVRSGGNTNTPAGSPSYTPTYSDLTVNGAGITVTLASLLPLNGTLTLTSGIIQTGTADPRQFTLQVAGPTATIVGGSSTSYVDGKLARDHNPGPADSRSFPIGKGGNYRPLTMTYNAETGISTNTAEQFETTMTGIPACTSVFAARQWTVTQSGATAFNYNITLDGTGFTPTGPAVIFKKDGATVTTFPATQVGNNYTASGLSSLSSFAIGQQNAAPTCTVTPPTATVPCGSSQMFCASPSGGTPPYTYSWSGPEQNGATTQCITVSTPGTYTVTVTDAAGCTTSCSATLFTTTTVTCSITGPTNVCPSSTTTYTGSVGASSYSWSVTGCGSIVGSSTSSSVDVLSCSSCSSSFTLNLIVTDSGGCTDTCSKVVSVTDTTPPTITACAPPATGTANASCKASVPDFTAGTTATDNCTASGSLTKTQSPAAGTLVGLGSTNVTVTVKDACNNSSSCITTFTVTDTTPPSITCPADITTNTAPGQCSQVVHFNSRDHIVISELRSRGPAGASDEFIELFNPTDSSVNIGNWKVLRSNSAGTTNLQVIITAGTILTSGQHYLVANGAAGGYSGSVAADQTYTVGFTDDGGIGLLLPNNTIVDQVGMSAGSTFKEGTTLTPMTAAQGTAGNSYKRASSGCQDTDNNAADFTLSTPSDPQNHTTSAATPCPVVSATDNCDPNPSVSCSPASGSSFPKGTNTVTCTAMDASGNSSNCMFNVIVNDNEAPTFAGCTNQVVTGCTGATTPTPVATDNCDGVVTASCTPSVLPLGSTLVSCTATDSSGNSANCSFTATVQDATPPSISCPPNTTVQCYSQVPPAATDYASFTAQGGSASDNCGAVTVMHSGDSESNPGSSCSNTISRTYTATDAAGNTNSCTQTITVNDTTAPSLTCPANTTIECSSSTNVTSTGSATATDNCGGTPTITSSDMVTPGSCAGNYTIARTFTATDTCGNSTNCTQTITVQDTTAPSVTCPPNKTGVNSVQCYSDTQPGGSAEAATDTASFEAQGGSVTDNCSAVTVTLDSQTESNPGSSCGNTIIRTYKAQDDCLNSSSCMQTIFVNDTTAPTFTNGCPNQTVTQVLVLTNATSCIKGDFNKEPISQGSYVWFSSQIKAESKAKTYTINITDQHITGDIGGSNVNISVPDAKVVFSSTISNATTHFVSGMWTTQVTLVVDDLDDHTFLSAVAYKLPFNSPGHGKLTWCGRFGIPVGTSVSWKWAAAVYTNGTDVTFEPSFGGNYEALGVKPVDGSKASIYPNKDKAGTPENYKQDVAKGARGEDKHNYTGHYTKKKHAHSKLVPATGGTSLFEEPEATDNCDPMPNVSCVPQTGSMFNPGTTNVTCTAMDECLNTSSCTFTVTVLQPLIVKFAATPPYDDNLPDDIESDKDGGTKSNIFTVGTNNVNLAGIFVHKVYVYSGTTNVTVKVGTNNAVTVNIDMTLRNQDSSTSSSLVTDLAENHGSGAYTNGIAGTPGNPGRMVYKSACKCFEFDLRTGPMSAGWETNTIKNLHFYRGDITARYSTSPTVVVGEEDSRLESK
jgi:hypothetical protein